MKTIRVAAACLNQTPLDWKGNLTRIIDAIDAAKAEKAELLCLPELCISGYGCEDAFFSDYVIQNSLRNLDLIAAHCEGIVVTLGLPIVHENCTYNCVALVADKKVLGFVAKQELAGDGVHYEPRWFKPWPDEVFGTFRWNNTDYPIGDLVFEVDGIRMGFEICEDAWNGVRPAQRHYLNNVDIILNPSASHFAFGRGEIREGIVREASRGYSCTYVYCSLLGNEAGRIIYDGEILIAQSGKLLANNERFGFEQVDVVSAIIDTAVPRREKKKSFAFEPEKTAQIIRSAFEFTPVYTGSDSEDYQIHAHDAKVQEFYYAVTLALWDYMRKSFSKGFIISLSGGADSSACLVLAVKALERARRELGETAFREALSYANLNWEKPIMPQLITTVYQATDNSTEDTETSARMLAESLGVQYFRWDVQQEVTHYTQQTEASLGRQLTWENDDLTLQNIQARVRAPGVWMLANEQNALLLSTSNRSEAAVGYATMDGDTAGGLAPLAGIDKQTLLNWLRWAETALDLPALRYVNSLQPSAELRPTATTQTDEEDLMPYPFLSKIEDMAIRQYQSPLECFISLRGLCDDASLYTYIVRFFKLWARNQWKRERYAPSFHLDDKNLDPKTWCRFPILSGGYRQELAELKRFVDEVVR